MGELIIGTSEVVTNDTFAVELSYTAGSGWKQLTIQDTNKIYFDNNVCKKAGVYSFCAELSGSGGTGTPSYCSVSVDGKVNVGAGWSGYMNPGSSCTVVKKMNVGDTITVRVMGASAIFGKAYCVVTKIV